MVLYAAMQEPAHQPQLPRSGQAGGRGGAPTAADIMTLIAQDEAYHGGGYRACAHLCRD